jgi:5-formyltetrahydrofolate cyclo-ligase
MPSKADLRREMRTRLREIGATRAALSERICTALVTRPEYQGARIVAVFDSLPTEPDLSLLWKIAPHSFAYPRIVDGKLQLFRVEAMSELTHSHPELPFREPPLIPERKVKLRDVQLMLVPGLAFSPDGRRLGRGGGYYDRLLANLPSGVPRLGVCFSFQVIPEIPTEPHDERVNALVTN